MAKVIEISGYSLSISQLIEVARRMTPVKMQEKAVKKMKESAAWLKAARQGDVKDTHVPAFEFFEKNRNLGSGSRKTLSKNEYEDRLKSWILSYQSEMKNPLPEDVVRAFLLLRANSLAKGESGVRPAAAETLLEMLNKKVHPFFPEHSCFGIHDELMPLSHLLLVMSTAEKEEREADSGLVIADFGTLSGQEAMQKAGIKRIHLEKWEEFAFSGGHQIAVAMIALMAHDLQHLVKAAETAAALSYEAAAVPFQPSGDRPKFPAALSGCSTTENHFQTLLKGSSFVDFSGEHPQASNAFRYFFQVMGNLRDLSGLAMEYIHLEINDSAHTPIISIDKKNGKKFSLPPYVHGLSVSLVWDLVNNLLAQLGKMSEKRIYRVMNPPYPTEAFIGRREKVSVNSCPVMHDLHALSVSLMLKNKLLARPSGADYWGETGDHGDYVVHSFLVAKNGQEILHNLAHIIAIELIVAATMISGPMAGKIGRRPGAGTGKVLAAVKKIITLKADGNYTSEDLNSLVTSMGDGEIRKLIDNLLE